mmetsp:Transcript_42640/g.96407  ORF Transcript_42640/g.96407 Transcript_42640/m.96407 type:complete len:259 (-) Transcript_42640:737-1513(-)
MQHAKNRHPHVSLNSCRSFRGVNHLGNVRAQRETCALRFCQISKMSDLALLVEILPHHLVNAAVGMFLKKRNGISIERKWYLLLLLLVHISMLQEFVTPLLIRARLEMEDTRSLDRHDMVAPSEAMGTMPIGVSSPAGGLAVAISEHLMLREHLDILKNAICRQRLGNGFDVDEDDASNSRGERLDDAGERLVKVEELVVVHMEQPLDAPLFAFGHRTLHLPLLSLHQRVVVVDGQRVVRIQRVVHPRSDRYEIGKLL